MLNQPKVVLDLSNPASVKNTLEQIMAKTGDKWRDCRRKSYDIHACKLPAGMVYANKLEQPLSYKAIMEKFRIPIVPLTAVKNVAGAEEYLQKNGCYVTSNEKITLCGTQGEMWEVKLEKLVSSYTNPDGSPIKPECIKLNKWFTISRAGSDVVSEVGLQIPKEIFMTVKTSWGVVYLNDPASPGHYKGDILVFPKSANGGPDYNKSCSPINNSVFALTFDRNVGGWDRIESLIPLEDTFNSTPKIEDLDKFIKDIMR